MAAKDFLQNQLVPVTEDRYSSKYVGSSPLHMPQYEPQDRMTMSRDTVFLVTPDTHSVDLLIELKTLNL